MRLPVDRALPLAALIFLGGCGIGEDRAAPLPAAPATGPAADYPMLIGDPFTVDGTAYTPEDKLSYDAVGYAAAGETGGETISGAHKTLPLPSYVEVTALDSGRTILVRLERRGPMANDTLIELSPGDATQLGIAGIAKAPVRVRRINPPEVERAMLRGGGRAPERMETPKGLLAVLKRKLEPQLAETPAAAASPSAEPTSAAAPPPEPKPSPAAASTPKAEPKPAPAPVSKPAASGSFVVQAATFSTEERARTAAARLGGHIGAAGRFWRMWLGPFATKADAQGALAKARSAGYSDARIQRGG